VVTHSVTLAVKAGSGQICGAVGSSSYCTGSVEVITVNDGATLGVNAQPAAGYSFDHYDGAGLGQPQTFSTAVTSDITIGVFFIVTPPPTVAHLGDTITIGVILTDSGGAPLTPDSQLVEFYDANGRQVGSYTSPTLVGGSPGLYTQDHQTYGFDVPSHYESINGVPTLINWRVRWTITVGSVVTSADLYFEVDE